MHQTQGRFEAIILQVEVELAQLRGGQHALVYEGLARQAREVHGLAAGAVLTRALLTEFVLHTLAHDERAALELHVVGGVARQRDEQLPEGGHGIAGQRADR